MICTFGLSVEEQRIYIKNLERLLKANSVDLTNRCPMATVERQTDGETFWSWPEETADIEDQFCPFCRENVGVPSDGPLSGGCPCRILGAREAVKRGREFIRRWKKAQR